MCEIGWWETDQENSSLQSSEQNKKVPVLCGKKKILVFHFTTTHLNVSDLSI